MHVSSAKPFPLPREPQDGSEWLRDCIEMRQDGPAMAPRPHQDGPKMVPSWPEAGPRQPKSFRSLGGFSDRNSGAPEWLQQAPKHSPKMATTWLRKPQLGPSSAQLQTQGSAPEAGPNCKRKCKCIHMCVYANCHVDIHVIMFT